MLVSDDSMDASDNKDLLANPKLKESLRLLTSEASVILNRSEDLELRLELEKEYKRQLRLEAKKLAEEESLKKRKETALKGMKYLLGVSEKYSNFFRGKVFSEDVKYDLFLSNIL